VVSPERASLAFGDAPADNPDATGGYYLQGELLGNVLDAMVRDSTREARGLDDIMRAMFARSLTTDKRGYAPGEFEQVADSVCGCRLDSFFAREVRGAERIDMRPVLGRLGLREVIDSIPATDSAGNAVSGYRRARVRLTDAATVTPTERARRDAWLRGGD
jgi:predicted metalloprotease with PDZ domain